MVDLRKKAAIQNLHNDARFDLMSEDIRGVAVAILDGHVQMFDKLEVISQTVQRGQHETNMLIEQSVGKIANAIAVLTTSTGTGLMSRSEADNSKANLGRGGKRHPR